VDFGDPHGRGGVYFIGTDLLREEGLPAEPGQWREIGFGCGAIRAGEKR
jgi:hypothetical protein